VSATRHTSLLLSCTPKRRSVDRDQRSKERFSKLVEQRMERFRQNGVVAHVSQESGMKREQSGEVRPLAPQMETRALESPMVRVHNDPLCGAKALLAKDVSEVRYPAVI